MTPNRPLLPPIVWVVLAVVGVLALLRLIGPVLAPFVTAAILAYILRPLVERLIRLRVPETPAVLIVLGLVALAFLVLLMLLVPLFYRQAAALFDKLPEIGSWVDTSLSPKLSEWLGTDVDFDLSHVRDWLNDNASQVKSVALAALPSLKSGTLTVVSTLVNLALVPLVMFYFLRDWPRLVALVESLLPRRMAPKVNALAAEFDRVLGEFLRGQISVMLVMAAYYSLALMVVRLPFALSIGVIAGLLVFIPYVGMATGLILATLAGVLQFDNLPQLIAVWVVFGIGQILEGFVVTPWLVGDRIGLHPVAVVFALMAFGQVFGFVGILLALPLAACLLVAIRHARTAYVGSAFYTRS